jgi:hypothetical protein
MEIVVAALEHALPRRELSGAIDPTFRKSSFNRHCKDLLSDLISALAVESCTQALRRRDPVHELIC